MRGAGDDQMKPVTWPGSREDREDREENSDLRIRARARGIGHLPVHQTDIFETSAKTLPILPILPRVRKTVVKTGSCKVEKRGRIAISDRAILPILPRKSIGNQDRVARVSGATRYGRAQA